MPRIINDVLAEPSRRLEYRLQVCPKPKVAGSVNTTSITWVRQDARILHSDVLVFGSESNE